MEIHAIYYTRVGFLPWFTWILKIYENRKISEKIVKKSQDHDYCFLIPSQTSKKRTLFYTTRSFGNQDLSSISKNSSSAWTIIHFLLPGTVTGARISQRHACCCDDRELIAGATAVSSVDCMGDLAKSRKSIQGAIPKSWKKCENYILQKIYMIRSMYSTMAVSEM